MVSTIIASAGLMVGLGLAFGAALAYASRRFHVPVDERAKKVEAALPGFNCAACGHSGCKVYSEAVLEGNAPVNACAPGGADTHKQIARILDVSVPKVEIMVSTVHCGGGVHCKDRFAYTGVASCAQAALLGSGQKACAYGCLGFGDCVRACKFGALSMGLDNLPVVDPAKCTACGLCAKACPKHIVYLTPKDKKFHVLCMSKDKGADVRKVCESGCIGCGLCVKNCPNQACSVNDNLSRIEYPKCNNVGKCAQVCPTKCISKLER
ncbi:MAG: RnfABCDGE type electron transport complex subunit B [Candidatus Altiarchaeota archaeon]